MSLFLKMTFNAKNGLLQLSPDDAKAASANFLCAIRNIKRAANIPLTPYKSDGPLSYADHAMHNLITGAEHLGIDLGARWGNELDSTNDR